MTFYSKDDVKHFDTVLVDGKIQTVPLLEASKGIVEMISMLGKAFTPVKSDITVNIEKLQKYDKNKEEFVTINAILDYELATKSRDLAKVGGLWLMRKKDMLMLIQELYGGFHILLVEERPGYNAPGKRPPIVSTETDKLPHIMSGKSWNTMHPGRDYQPSASKLAKFQNFSHSVKQMIARLVNPSGELNLIL